MPHNKDHPNLGFYLEKDHRLGIRMTSNSMLILLLNTLGKYDLDEMLGLKLWIL